MSVYSTLLLIITAASVEPEFLQVTCVDRIGQFREAERREQRAEFDAIFAQFNRLNQQLIAIEKRRQQTQTLLKTVVDATYAQQLKQQLQELDADITEKRPALKKIVAQVQAVSDQLEQWRRDDEIAWQKVHSLVRRNQLLVELWRLTGSNDDEVFLEGAIVDLSTAKDHTNSLSILEAFVRRNWMKGADQSNLEYLDGVAQRPRDLTFLVEFDKNCAELKRLTGSTWPFDWRKDKDFWLGFADELIQSRQHVNLVRRWQNRIDQDPQRDRLYRCAYLAVVRAREPGSMDFEFVRPLTVDVVQGQSRQNRNVAIVLASALRAKVPVDHPQIEVLLSQSIDAIGKVNATHHSELYRVCAEGHRYRDGANRLAAAVVAHWKPYDFAEFGRLSGMTTDEMRNWFLRRPTAIDVVDRPVKEVLRDLEDLLYDVPLWVDYAALAEDRRITLKASGTWRDVVGQVVRQADLTYAILLNDMAWIGPAASRGAAESLLQESLSRLRPYPSSLPSLQNGYLRDQGISEFINTPLKDVADYISDYVHLSHVLIRGIDPQRPVSVNLSRRLPAHLALTLLGRQVGFDWRLERERTLIIGSPEEVERFHRRAGDFERRMRVAADVGGEVLDGLLDRPTSWEISATPLAEVIDDWWDIRRYIVVVGDGAIGQLPISSQLRVETFGWALELLCEQNGLAWHTDGRKLYIGKPADIESFVRRRPTPSPLSARTDE